MDKSGLQLALVALCVLLFYAASFVTKQNFQLEHRHREQAFHISFHNSKGDDVDESSYESSGLIIKYIVSSLTSITNAFSSPLTLNVSESNLSLLQGEKQSTAAAPTSVEELMERIKVDYKENNYLWTGNLGISSFFKDCNFTDPTLSFVGVDSYVKNVGNLLPVVDFFLGKEQLCRSELLEIFIDRKQCFIQTRWNMVGELNRLPWKPKIDVIGRTKFWYKQRDIEPIVQVYYYDEKWEIPAGLALLQLITPACTIPNSLI